MLVQVPWSIWRCRGRYGGAVLFARFFIDGRRHGAGAAGDDQGVAGGDVQVLLFKIKIGASTTGVSSRHVPCLLMGIWECAWARAVSNLTLIIIADITYTVKYILVFKMLPK